MSAVPNPEPAPVPPAAPSPKWVTIASLALKLAVAGLIVVAAWALVSAYRDVLPGRSTSDARSTAAAGPADSDGDWLLSSGGWSLGETPWQANRATLSTDECDRRLTATGGMSPDGPIHPMEAEVIGWLKRSAVAGPKRGSATDYKLTVNRTQFRGVVESTPAGERLRLGQVAWPGSGEDWELLELLPLTGGVAASEPLLAVPAGAASVARRWSGDRVVAEWIGPISPDANPADEWSKAGWERSPVAGAPIAAERFTRGGTVREVWRFAGPPGASGQDYLLIFLPNVRRPEVAR